ncbi:hypothetical protein KIN20_005763 [Parelaphostrongylus tenuis]|uniref:Uncharacterized protein n=1 Tax=Parelaphostrongylus tenuis TaxID=148309 RepID=A0AAD5MLK6_PARTN|nr:hypothetical protein KIN20_005763 [Parelaphostrongylus tenuis]
MSGTAKWTACIDSIQRGLGNHQRFVRMAYFRDNGQIRTTGKFNYLNNTFLEIFVTIVQTDHDERSSVDPVRASGVVLPGRGIERTAIFTLQGMIIHDATRILIAMAWIIVGELQSYNAATISTIMLSCMQDFKSQLELHSLSQLFQDT